MKASCAPQKRRRAHQGGRFYLVASGIEPKFVLYLIDALEALVTGPEGVLAFNSDEVDSLDRRLRGKAVARSDDSDRKETRPGHASSSKMGEGRWANAVDRVERTGEPLEREEELSEEVRTIVNEASKTVAAESLKYSHASLSL